MTTNEYETREPHPRLRPFVEQYVGYRMSGLAPGVHAGLPSSSLTMIIAFDDPLDVVDGHRPEHRDIYWGMLAGLHSQPARVHHPGRQHGIQLNVTPRGANALFAAPAASLAHTVAHLDAVVPSWAGELVERATIARSWQARWSILDEIFLRVLDLDRPMPCELEEAWATMRRTHGATTVSDLAEIAGWSRRHFTKQFTAHYGLTPKTMSRVLRFERAQRMVRLPTRPSLGSVAAACGYADQAHMTRDWTEFAGAAPTQWLTDEILPDT